MMNYSDGDKFVGEFKDDKYHGQGTFTWAFGSSLEATWTEDVPGGNAKWIQEDGDYYVGEIKGSKKPDGGWKFVLDGQGIFTYSYGSIKSGVWAEGEFVESRSVSSVEAYLDNLIK